jgi:NosR/NirI family nitrous oxide reductase transcriptional regulator
MMRIALTWLGLISIAAAGQSPAAIEARTLEQLRRVMPSAARFSPREGTPPHFTAYAGGPIGEQTVPAGYAFWTTDVEPLERGYDGPIKILVGMDAKGVLTGILVAEDHEPYGNFSVETPAFAAQFKGKNIRDPFRVGGDIDAISRATISVTSASRAVRNSARRVARAVAMLAPTGMDR